jgi:ABC-2 type transport system ATP-binding protein
METVLELKGVTKAIKGKMIIDDINFAVKKGQIYGFLGPNGAGKTMTLRMIVGLIRPTKGEIKICGHSVTGAFVQAMEKIGCIIETPQFYEYMSGYDNLDFLSRMEPGTDADDIADAVKRVGMDHRIHDKVHTYSLGMKQRLGIAQAIMKKPSLLILDEPVNGLDPAGIKEFRELVKSLALESGMTLLISSHLLSEIQLMCDEAAIILHGRIIKILKVESLKRYQVATWNLMDVAKAVDLLKNQFNIVPVDHTAHSLSAVVDDDLLPAINAVMAKADVGIIHVCRQNKSLEDLFMELTGGETIG